MWLWARGCFAEHAEPCMAARTVQPNTAQAWCSLSGFLRHVQTGWLTPTHRNLIRLSARPPGEGRDMRMGACSSPPTSQSTWHKKCWYCPEALSSYCSVLDMWNRFHMNSKSVWILWGHFCGWFSSITQCHCYWLCCFFLVGFLQMVILVLSHGASDFMVCLFCDSQLFDLWDLFVLFLQVLIWCQKTLCFQRLTVLMFNSQKYWLAIGRRVCLLRLAMLLKNNSICFMPKSPCVPFQTTFMLAAAKPNTLEMKKGVCQMFSHIFSNPLAVFALKFFT